MADVSPGQVSQELSERFARDCVERLRLEVARLQREGFLSRGTASPQVLFVKGSLDDEERASGRLLGGRDGAALNAACSSLGYPDDACAAISACVLGEGGSWQAASGEKMAWAIEVLDPEVVIATDDSAIRALSDAWEMPEGLREGQVVNVLGRRVLALGDFAGSLDDQRLKRVMWERLKLVPPLSDPL